MSVARSSRLKITPDLNKSHGSFLVDASTGKEYLDFFSMYSSLPLGYNHKIFESYDFIEEILEVSSVKVTNCEFITKHSIDFDEQFKKFTSLGKFSHYHYCCTGALAIEAAIKTAIDYKKAKNPKILSFAGAFHGINSWGCFTTSRTGPVTSRLEGFPDMFSKKVKNDSSREVMEQIFKNNDLTAVLLEPIQATFGDQYVTKEFIRTLRDLCSDYNVPLIFDEVQIGFGATGKVWYFEHLGIEPDILVFGKRTQLSGIMVKDNFSEIFKTPIRLEVTWDGTLVDMIRCKHVIRAYEEDKILQNVEKQSQKIVDYLKNNENFLNVRNKGMIIAFDFASSEKCEDYTKKMHQNGLIFNKTGNKTIRFRPSLSITDEELKCFFEISKFD